MKHLKQLTGNDCVLASIAMLKRADSVGDVWSAEDVQSVVKSHGVGDLTPWLKKVGFELSDFREINIGNRDLSLVRALLWRRRALLTVDSLNNEGGSHMVYWDGERIFDPQEGVEGKQHFKFITSVCISRVFIFKD